MTRSVLQAALPDQIMALQRWLPDQAALDQWGGPGFSFPIRPLQFQQQLYLPRTQSFWLVEQQQAIAFGQLCDRFERNHLARLLVAPTKRGQGVGKRLIMALMQQAIRQQSTRDFSLFVFRKNQPALRCYQQLGFSFSPQPGDEHPDLYFMTLSWQQAAKRLEV